MHAFTLTEPCWGIVFVLALVLYPLVMHTQL